MGNNFFSPEMAHDVIESPDFLWTTRIFDTIITILLLVLLIDHLYFTYGDDIKEFVENHFLEHFRRSHKLSDTPPTIRKRTTSGNTNELPHIWFRLRNIIITIFILSSFLTSLLQWLNIWSVFNYQKVSCQVIMDVYTLFYHLSKISLYCIFVVSAHIAFHGSIFTYSKKFILSCLIFITIFGIFLLVFSDDAIEGVWLTDPVTWCHIHIRKGLVIQIGLGFWIFISLFLNIVSLAIFVKPLIKLMNIMDISTEHHRKQVSNHKITNLIIKFNILNGIAIISSFSSLLIYLFTHISTPIDIDILIAAASVLIATSKHHENLYQIICKPCHKTETARQHRILKKRASKQELGKRSSVPSKSLNSKLDLTGTHIRSHSELSPNPKNLNHLSIHHAMTHSTESIDTLTPHSIGIDDDNDNDNSKNVGLVFIESSKDNNENENENDDIKNIDLNLNENENQTEKENEMDKEIENTTQNEIEIIDDSTDNENENGNNNTTVKRHQKKSRKRIVINSSSIRGTVLSENDSETEI